MQILMYHPNYPNNSRVVNPNNVEMLEKLGWKRQDKIDMPAEIVKFTEAAKEKAKENGLKGMGNAATIIPVTILEAPIITEDVPGVESEVEVTPIETKTEETKPVEKELEEIKEPVTKTETAPVVKKVAGRPKSKRK